MPVLRFCFLGRCGGVVDSIMIIQIICPSPLPSTKKVFFEASNRGLEGHHFSCISMCLREHHFGDWFIAKVVIVGGRSDGADCALLLG